VVCDECQAAEEETFGPGPATPKDPRDWLHGLGVNTRKHGDATLDNFDATYTSKALDAARLFVEETVTAGKHDRVRGLYLLHETKGTGKSHLAVAIMRAVHERRPDLPMAYVPVDRFVARVQDSYGTGTTDALIESVARRPHLLVFDDLGREKGTDDALRVLSTVLDEREGAATVITANGTPADLAGRYRDSELWDRVASRLGDLVYRYVAVPGVDRRFMAEPNGARTA
jgi:DNA replication protein DnaC